MSNATDIAEYPVMVTIGDECGLAKKLRFRDGRVAEEWATAMLGREWGETRTISVATFYKLGPDNGWVFDSEMEF
jgi:hypothetical protein